MKKSLLAISTAAFAGMATFFGATTSAGDYPVAPPGTYVTLPLSNFVQSVPSQSPGLPVPNPVIGDHVGQHPGGFATGQPMPGTFFIGVLAGSIDTSDLAAGVYLWETSYPGSGGATGPEIQLGHWDGMTFSAYGSPQPASYSGTGVLADVGGGLYYEIFSSFTLLSAFGISLGSPLLLDAVKITATGSAHNQVTAVAVTGYGYQPPESPLLSIRVSQVELCWDSVTNAAYQLQYRSELTTNAWVPFATNFVQGTGGTICSNETVFPGQTQRYYRVAVTNQVPGM